MRGSNRTNPAASHCRPDRIEHPATPCAAYRVVAHLPRTCGARPNPDWRRSTATARCRSAGHCRTRPRRVPHIGSLRTVPHTCGARPNRSGGDRPPRPGADWPGLCRARPRRVPRIGSLRTFPHTCGARPNRTGGDRPPRPGADWPGLCRARPRRVPHIGSLRTSPRTCGARPYPNWRRATATARCRSAGHPQTTTPCAAYRVVAHLLPRAALARTCTRAINRHRPMPIGPTLPHPTTPRAAYRVVAHLPRTCGARPYPDWRRSTATARCR